MITVPLVLFVLHVLSAVGCGKYARHHGLPFFVGFLISFLAPVVGSVVVLVLPHVIELLS